MRIVEIADLIAINSSDLRKARESAELRKSTT